MDLKNLTIKQASEDLRSGKYSSEELTKETFTRIKVIDEKVKAFVSLTEEEALSKAKEVDKDGFTSLISGIPGSLKDLFNWKGVRTTASSNMLKDYVSPYNSTVTQKLLDAGSVLVGKTNLDAFAHGSSTEKSDFFTTKNPWNLDHLPGGSSGGSAAAVIAGMGLYSIGTATGGSIRQPASWCGVCGFKPTYGRVSRYGVIAMGSSLDSPGPLCKSVEDCAILLDILTGKDEKDATTSPRDKEEYFKNLSKDIKGKKIGLPKQYFNQDLIQEEVIIKVKEAVKELEKLGAEIIDMDLLDPKFAIAVYTVIQRSEVSSNLARYDGIVMGHRSDKHAEDVLDQISNNRGEGFGNEAKQRSMTGGYALAAGYDHELYKKAQRVRTLIRKDLDKAFSNVDLIIGPSTPSTALKIGATAGNPLFGEMADALVEASTLVGNPGINIPVGFDKQGLPIGMDIFAPQFAEQEVLNMGYAYQNVTDFHRQVVEM